MTLNGNFVLDPMPNCQTVDLDHPTQDDFSQTSIFNTTMEELDIGWDSCWKKPLGGMVTAAMVTWTGEGTWSPNTICFDWDDVTNKVSVCSISPSTEPHLTTGQSVSLDCRIGDKKDC